MADANSPTTTKQLAIFYGGSLILILVAIYLLRHSLYPITSAVQAAYADAMDSLSGRAFNTYVVPDNFHRT
jgi:hypothetical protein